MNSTKGADGAGGGSDSGGVRAYLQKFLFAREASDLRWAIVIGAGFSILYGLIAWRFSRGHFYEHYNLLFDFDPPAYINLFAPQGASSVHTDDIARAIKHPLASWLSLFSLPFTLFGADRLTSVILANVCVGGATCAVLFAFARTVGTRRIEALLVTLIFGLGASQLFSSLIVESYSYAALSLAVVWYIGARRISGAKRLGLVAIATDVVVFGITITNVAQAAIAELFTQWSQLSLSRALRNTLIAGAAVAALCTLGVALTWPQAVSYLVAHPIQSAKEVYWQQTYGERTGLGQILLTFLGFSLVAPHFDKVILPEGILMRDFRTFDPSLISITGMLAWNVILVTGAFAAIRLGRTRFLAGALASAIIFNAVLHMRVQFRGSLFLYTPHLWIAIAALVALGIAAIQISQQRLDWYVRGALVVILLTIAPTNIARAIEASKLFDRPSEFLSVRHNAASQAPEHRVDRQ